MLILNTYRKERNAHACKCSRRHTCYTARARPHSGACCSGASPGRAGLSSANRRSVDLRLYGFAGATFMVAANLAGWYGGATSPHFLFPFAAAFGGLAQFMAGMWAYRARDGLATAMHGMWGAFWIAFGILFLLVATGDISVPSGTWPELGYWFLTLGAITGIGAVASVAENLGLTATLAPLSVGSMLLA